MKSKKLIVVLVAIITLIYTFSGTVLAGHHNNKSSSRISYSNCNVSGCTKTSNHTHNGKYYYGHSSSDGHNYHNNSISYRKCNITNCTKTSNHTLNGKYYYGHSSNDGHSYHTAKYNTGKHH